MITAVTSPAGRGARAPDAGRGLLRSPSRRRLVTAVVGVVVLVAGSLVLVSDLRARTEIGTADVSVTSAGHQLARLRTDLARAEQRLAGARARRAVVTRAFDDAQFTLSVTQKSLARDEAGIHSQGVDVGELDSCLSGVEQALNQISVGQTAGGLASLRASSSSCSALNESA
jgi:hypothetical protein